MNLLEIIYLCGAMALGLIFGMIVELMIDAETIRDLQAQNRKLRLELAQERQTDHVEIINRVEVAEPQKAEQIDYSQNW